MYSFSYLEPVCCSMSSSNCFFLICKQISHEAGQVVWYSHLLEEFSSLLWSIQSKAMATHSSTPAWKIPWTGEPGGLQFMGSLRVRHDWVASLSHIGEGNGIAFLWDWNENWPFPVLWPLMSFPNLLAYWVKHFHSITFQDLKQLNWNSVTSTSFVCSDAS